SLREGFVEALVKKFIHSAQRHLIDMEKAAREHDIQAYQDIAHALKGSSGTVGAMSMYQVCDEIEREKQQLTSDKMVSNAARLKDVFQECCKEFEHYLA
ncbi:MAG: Hpt domain-containing protein, partial [Mariprofundus sp.]